MLTSKVILALREPHTPEYKNTIMQTITLKITDESQGLDPAELADFLYLFRGANLALNRIVAKKDWELLRSPSVAELETYRGRLSRFSPDELDSFFDPKAAPEFLQIKRISRQSPIEIDLSGCAYLLILAVIFSGGSISIAGVVKAKLPAFGEGLKRLREALGLNKTLQASFGIRSTIIKLTKEERRALLQTPKGQGGFQNLLLRLQHRINKQTGDLELSQNDLERIYRYKANPKKGGFQGRFNKIFGRQFPDQIGG